MTCACTERTLRDLVAAQGEAWCHPLRAGEPRLVRVLDAEIDGLRGYVAQGGEHLVEVVSACWPLRDVPALITVREVSW